MCCAAGTRRHWAGALAGDAFRVPGVAGTGPPGRPRLPRTDPGHPTVTFDGDRVKFGYESRLAPSDTDGIIADVYSLVGDLAKKRSAAIVLDEFQAIVDLGEHLPGLFKSLADAQPNVALVVAGSKKHLMDQLVAAPSAALYNMAERLALGPLPDDVMADYLVARARWRETDGGGGGLADRLKPPAPSPTTSSASPTKRTTTEPPPSPPPSTAAWPASSPQSDTFAERFELLAPGQRRCSSPWPNNQPAPRRRPRSSPAPDWPTTRRSAKR